MEVTDDERISEGGGLEEEGELIRVVDIPVPKAKSLIYDSDLALPVELKFALLWFFAEKLPTMRTG